MFMLYSNLFQGVIKTVSQTVQKTGTRGKHVIILSCSVDEDIKSGDCLPGYYKL